MKIHIGNYQPNKIGGGWTFTDNFAQGLGENLVDYDQADIYFIAGATMVERRDVERAKADGKKVVLRVDNHLLPSRNRNTGMQKLKDFAELADLLIYQSEWARDYLRNYTDKNGFVVYNGVDLEVFKDATFAPSRGENNYLYARSSRIAEKGWELARYLFSRISMDEPGSFLSIVGKFSGENLDYNFDFFNGEGYRFYGQVGRDQFAALLSTSKHFLYSYFYDACSNTLIEALASGCEIVDVAGALKTGGAPEIMAAYEKNGREWLSLHRMTGEYIKQMEKL